MSGLPAHQPASVDDEGELDLTNPSVGIPFEERGRQQEEESLSGSPTSSSNPQPSPKGSFATRPSVYPHISEIPPCLDVDEAFEKLTISIHPGRGRLANPTPDVPGGNLSPSRRESMSNRYDSFNPRHESYNIAEGERRSSLTPRDQLISRRGSSASSGSIYSWNREYNDTSEYDSRMSLSSRSNPGSRRGSSCHEGIGMGRTTGVYDHPSDTVSQDRLFRMDRRPSARRDDNTASHYPDYRIEELRYRMQARDGDYQWSERGASYPRDYGEHRRLSIPIPERLPLQGAAYQSVRREDSFRTERGEVRNDRSMIYPTQAEDFNRYGRDEYHERHNHGSRRARNERSQRYYCDDQGDYRDNQKPEHRMVEVTPGYFVPLRGSAETLEAVHKGRIQHAMCFVCKLRIVCVEDADMVICPTCRTISPLEGVGGGIGGLGLGLKEELAKNEMRSMKSNK